MAAAWVGSASDEDMGLISMLRIPKSFIGAVPRMAKQILRERVAWHQYHMLHAVVRLRGVLSLPPRQDNGALTPSTSTTAWYNAVASRAVKPNPMAKALLAQTLYKPKELKRAAAAKRPAEVRL